jgi:hypothetical protein
MFAIHLPSRRIRANFDRDLLFADRRSQDVQQLKLPSRHEPRLAVDFSRRNNLMIRAARIALLGTAALIAANAGAIANGVSVPMDEVRMIAFSQPVTTVYVGNPVIADVTMIDAEHAFLLGKTFGETNVIALGSNGKQISNQHVVVFGRRMGAVTLNRGASTFNYTCTSLHCETQPVPGDPKTYFDETHQAIDTHEGMGIKGASANTGNH